MVAPVDVNRLSGTPVRVRTTSSALSRRFKTTVICTKSDSPDAVVIDDAWSTGTEPRFRLFRFSRRALVALWRVRPDVVHAVTPGAVPAAVLYRALNPDSRLIFEIHGLIRYEMKSANRAARSLFSALDRLGLWGADHVIAMSRVQRKELLRLYRRLSGDRVQVLWGPVDLEEYPAGRDERSRDVFKIGYLGGGSFWQDLSTVARAAVLLRNERRLRFVLAGFPPDEGAASPNLEFLGELPRDRGPAFLAACDVLLSPRVRGPVTDLQYPHKLSHYLAAGRPIVGADVNDQGWIIREAGCGLTFTAGDAASLASAVSSLAAFGEQERAEMGARARQFAEQHLSLERLVDQLETIYTMNTEPMRD